MTDETNDGETEFEWIRTILTGALDLRDRRAELLFWDIKFSLVDNCWDHCHIPLAKEHRREADELQRQIIELEGQLPNDDESWAEQHPELYSWYLEEIKRRDAALAQKFLELEQ